MAEDLSISTSTNKAEQYAALLPQIEALVACEADMVANLAQNPLGVVGKEDANPKIKTSASLTRLRTKWNSTHSFPSGRRPKNKKESHNKGYFSFVIYVLRIGIL